MRAEEYKHTWVIPRNAWYIKTYLWLWKADKNDVTFCKLFWGYTLCWLALIFGVIELPARLMLIALQHIPTPEPLRCEHDQHPERCMHAACIERRDVEERLLKSRMVARKDKFLAAKQRVLDTLPMRVLNSIASGVAWLIMGIDSFLIRRWIAIPLLVIVALVGLAAIGVGIYQIWITVSLAQFLHALLVIGAVIGGICVALGLIGTVMFLFIDKALAEKSCRYIFQPAGRGISRGALGFKDVMRIGYVSVKGNTCPRVVVDDD